MTPADMVITDLEGNLVEGSLRPSSDLATHVALYRAFPEIGGVVHTHSRHATAWAQADREIPCFGTTHADYFHGEIPITAQLSREEIEADYEANTGVAIIARMKGIDPLGCPACLVAGHAPFCWGKTVTEAAHMAVIVEEIAAMAWQTVTINPAARPISEAAPRQAPLPQARPHRLLRPKMTRTPCPNQPRPIRAATVRERLLLIA